MVKLFLVAFLFLHSQLAASAEFIIGINEREVFRYKDNNGQWLGKDIDLINAVFRHTPHTYKLVAMPWARVLKSLEFGLVDLTIAAAALLSVKLMLGFQKRHFATVITRFLFARTELSYSIISAALPILKTAKP